MKRCIDIVVACFALVVLSFPAAIIALLIFLTSRGGVLFWSKRAGQAGKVFWMPKFRTMNVGTPNLPTAELASPSSYLTPIGGFLRRTSLDEIPQLYCVLCGQMSLVGPRPVILEEAELLNLRSSKGIDMLLPGITGLAQINGRDNLSIDQKVAYEELYLRQKSTLLDLKILVITIKAVLFRSDVSH